MSSELIVQTSNPNFDADVRATGYVLVDFWAPWCGPCRAIAPYLESVARDYAGRVKVVKMNVDDDVEGEGNLSERFTVRGIPTLLIMKDGEIVERVVGANRLRLAFLLDELAGKPAADAAVPAPAAAAEPVAAAVPLRSFLGDPARKQAALAALVVSPENEEKSPVECLLDDPARFVDEFGMPPAVAGLIDGFDKPHAALLIEAVPVGIDLQPLMASTLMWLLGDGPHGFGAQVAGNASLAAMLARVVALQRAHIDGAAADAGAWYDLRRDAIALAKSLDDTPLELQAGVLEHLTEPFGGDAGQAQVQAVLGAILHFKEEALALWTAEEQSAMEALSIERSQLRSAELGDLPEGSSQAEQDVFFARLDEIDARLEATERITHATLWARLDESYAAGPRLSLELCTATADFFVQQLRQTGEAA